MALGGEDLAAPGYVTAKRLFSSVDSDMGFEVAVFCKALPTNIAFEGFLSCVGSLVNF